MIRKSNTSQIDITSNRKSSNLLNFIPLNPLEDDHDIVDVKHEHRKKLIDAAKRKANRGFSKLGYGMIAYFNFYEYLILLFFVMTLLTLPSMYLFSTTQKGNQEYTDQRQGRLFKYNMGSYGFSSTLCRNIGVGIGKLSLSCETGRIKKIVDFGIIPSNARILDACLQNQETKPCK